MKRSHTPTKAIQSAAKRGLELAGKPEVSNNDILDVSMKGGKKLSNGAKISDDHVRSMAEYHAAHGGACPSGDDAEGAEDLLWGGPAGAAWAASRVAAMDATTLAQSSSPDIDQLLSGTDPFSIEVYSRRDLLGEKIDLKRDDEGLIWAPIIRSGTMAVRPDPTSPTGRKQEPLVFVKGHAATGKEIGLADLFDAFNDTAVQHVTIPRTHRNDEFENTGFIRKLRIAESTLRPGEEVILAGHEFLDSDAEARVEKGLIANRSCGILHGYQNTETGKVYPHVIEHVALTNKPWVTGMEAYGTDTFSDGRQVVPMMLSEERTISFDIGEEDPEQLPPTIFSTATPREMLERELHLADIIWDDEDGEPSLSRIQSQLYDSLREMGKSPYWDEDSIWFSVRDVKPSKALVSVNYDYSDDEDAWVVPYSYADGELRLSDFSQWQVVHQAWVADDDANQDKDEVQAILAGGETALSLEANTRIPEHMLRLATLTAKARKDLPDSDFVFPKTREYPIQDLAHGRSALQRGSQNETGTRLAAIRSAVYKKYPQLKNSGSSSSSSSKTNTSLPTDPLKRASVLRLSGQQPYQQGGAMPITEQLLGQLNLDDTSRELLRRQMQEDQVKASGDADALRRFRENERKDGIERIITGLSERGLSAERGFSAFLNEVHTLLTADDGDVAAKLNLADRPGEVQHLTVTQMINRLVNALPKPGEPAATTALANKTSLIENPLSGRPGLEPDKTELDGHQMSGDELLAQWNKDIGPGGLDLSLAPAPGATTTAAAA